MAVYLLLLFEPKASDSTYGLFLSRRRQSAGLCSLLEPKTKQTQGNGCRRCKNHGDCWTTRIRVAKATHFMGEVQLLRNGHCAGRLSLETALLPPPIRRRWWRRPAVLGRPCCRRGACHFWRRGSTASFVTWSAASNCGSCDSLRLLVACETSKLGISSEQS